MKRTRPAALFFLLFFIELTFSLLRLRAAR
jgi:hypothetical protein